MSNWTGRMGKGAGRARRIEKREEAQARDAASTYNADIRRVAADQNVSPRTARHVVNAGRRLERVKTVKRRERLAGLAAYRDGLPFDESASSAWRSGWNYAARGAAEFLTDGATS